MGVVGRWGFRRETEGEVTLAEAGGVERVLGRNFPEIVRERAEFW